MGVFSEFLEASTEALQPREPREPQAQLGERLGEGSKRIDQRTSYLDVITPWAWPLLKLLPMVLLLLQLLALGIQSKATYC